MIKRIVKLTFEEDKIEDFLKSFDENKKNIAAFDGCLHLELLRCSSPSNIFFTYSFWESESQLNAYRNSDLFKTVWAKTKILFADKPEAWSINFSDSVKTYLL